MLQWTTNGTRALGKGVARPTTRSATWSWLAVVPGATVWILLAVSALLPAPNDDPMSQAHLATLAAQVNRGLPRKVDAEATLVSVSGGSGVLVYTVRLMNGEAGDGDTRRRVSEVAASLTRWECAEQRLRPYIDRGVTMRHVFEDPTGRRIATVEFSSDDCGS